MKKLFLVLLGLALVCGMAVVAFGVAVGVPGHDVHVVINDREWNAAELGGWHAAAAGGLASLVAVCAVAIVLPLALLFGVLLPLFLVAGVVLALCAAVLGVGALALAPLMLPLLLLWWLWRRARRADAVAVPRTTIAP